MFLLQLQRDFNEDKKQAVARAVGNTSREVDRIRRQTEDKCKEQYMEEMKKLAQKHKEAISQTKKKQWVCIVFVDVYKLPTVEYSSFTNDFTLPACNLSLQKTLVHTFLK